MRDSAHIHKTYKVKEVPEDVSQSKNKSAKRDYHVFNEPYENIRVVGGDDCAPPLDR